MCHQLADGNKLLLERRRPARSARLKDFTPSLGDKFSPTTEAHALLVIHCDCKCRLLDEDSFVGSDGSQNGRSRDIGFSQTCPRPIKKMPSGCLGVCRLQAPTSTIGMNAGLAIEAPPKTFRRLRLHPMVLASCETRNEASSPSASLSKASRRPFA
jgi:hypothetical protein